MQRTALVVLVLSTTLLLGAGPEKSAGYDPARDPYQDLEKAVAQATEGGKRILIEVGGEWCKWCHILERFLKGDEEVLAALRDNFVVLKVNYNPEQENEEFLGQYPKITGYPHIFVLESDGSFLHSQNTAELEKGDSYDRQRMLKFFRRWAPGE